VSSSEGLPPPGPPGDGDRAEAWLKHEVAVHQLLGALADELVAGHQLAVGGDVAGEHPSLGGDCLLPRWYLLAARSFECWSEPTEGGASGLPLFPLFACVVGAPSISPPFVAWCCCLVGVTGRRPGRGQSLLGERGVGGVELDTEPVAVVALGKEGRGVGSEKRIEDRPCRLPIWQLQLGGSAARPQARQTRGGQVASSGRSTSVNGKTAKCAPVVMRAISTAMMTAKLVAAARRRKR
jgi:hypothetical protein